MSDHRIQLLPLPDKFLTYVSSFEPLLVWRIAHSRNNNKIDFFSVTSLSVAPSCSFKFRDNGHCRFGLKCRYRHERVYQHYNQSNDRENRFGSTKPHVRSNVTSRNFSDVNAVNTSNNGFNYFLEDMKSIVSTLKDITETQRQFTALPPTQMQGYQHHQFMPLTNQGQQVWPVAVQQ